MKDFFLSFLCSISLYLGSTPNNLLFRLLQTFLCWVVESTKISVLVKNSDTNLGTLNFIRLDFDLILGIFSIYIKKYIFVRDLHLLSII